MGTEEVEIIRPAIEMLRAEGIDANGPFSADTLFDPYARKGYDAAICMYHDQALIPLKTLHFDDGVNMTLGLPIVRTAPDHGTAFALAGRNAARGDARSEEHTSELQSLMRLSYAVFCLKTKKNNT